MNALHELNKNFMAKEGMREKEGERLLTTNTAKLITTFRFYFNLLDFKVTISLDISSEVL